MGLAGYDVESIQMRRQYTVFRARCLPALYQGQPFVILEIRKQEFLEALE